MRLTPASQIKQQSSPGGIFVGCSGWAYPTWKPGFYPATVPAKKFLEYYASQLNSVEVNYTFRSLPSATTIASWLAATGPDFRFTFKAPQRITHISRLKNCGAALAAFAESMEPVTSATPLSVAKSAAQGILRAAAFDLASIAENLAERLQLRKMPFLLAKTGGMIGRCKFLEEQLDARLRGSFPKAEIGLLRVGPAEAAAKLALRLLGPENAVGGTTTSGNMIVH